MEIVSLKVMKMARFSHNSIFSESFQYRAGWKKHKLVSEFSACWHQAMQSAVPESSNLGFNCPVSIADIKSR